MRTSWKLLGLALAVLLPACSETPTANHSQPSLQLARAGAVTPGVVPRNARPLGRTYEEWGGALLQWVCAIPTPTNPFLDATGAFTQAHNSGKVWFLMGPSSWLPQPQAGAITMPAGTAIVYAPLAWYGTGPTGITGDGDDTPEELRTLMDWLMTLTPDPQVTIDGVPVADIEQYRLVSPAVDLLPTEDNICLWGYPPPITFGILAGYAHVLDPLPPGVHTLHTWGDFVWGPPFDLTYTITVVPGR